MILDSFNSSESDNIAIVASDLNSWKSSEIIIDIVLFVLSSGIGGGWDRGSDADRG